MKATSTDRLPDSSSFRDPSGFIFRSQGKLYRQVNVSYRAEYDQLMKSGLYQRLVDDSLLVMHKEAPLSHKVTDQAYKVIQPEVVPVISYPYEWSFSQLRDAALATLQIQRLALEYGLSLKDASAYNIQFLYNRPVFIDTLSFEAYEEKPWVAYRQFCQHFLAPLAVMTFTDLRLQTLLWSHIDGIPLDLASKLLPARTKLQPGLLMHIHLHGRSQVQHAGDAAKADGSSSSGNRTMSKQSLLGLLDSLESAVKKLSLPRQQTEWASYYESNNNYSDKAMQAKQKLVRKFVKELKPKTAWDIGANTGMFSFIAAEEGAQTVALDIDTMAVERLYLHARHDGLDTVLPLVFDMTNPSPDLGWGNAERQSMYERGPAEVVLALAVVHHLAISNNVPLTMIAEQFHRMASKGLIVEFIPKEDSQVQKLLATREDIFDQYHKEGFEKAFGVYFTVKQVEAVKPSKRWLYLMEPRRVA